jgi:alpha-tubulin suppressor-like RCC1 family protein/cytoskeletal protein CcmA (bactofilin family)
LRSNLYVSGDTVIGCNLTASNATWFGSNLYVSGDAVIGCNLTASNAAWFGSNLYVSGDTVIGCNLTASNATWLRSNLYVSGDTEIGCNLTVSNATWLRSNLHVSGDTVIGCNLTASNAVWLRSNLYVSVDTVIGRSLTTTHLTATGTLSFPDSSINSAAIIGGGRVAGIDEGVVSAQRVMTGSGGEDQSFVLTAQGQVHAWGNNDNGQLGNNTAAPASVPIAISTFGSLSGNSIVTIASGLIHTLALDASGKVHAWGDNSYGQLGNNTGEVHAWGWNAPYDPARQSRVPISVSAFGSLSGQTVVAIACGKKHSVAVDASGRVHVWGWNIYNQLGNNTSTDSIVPVLISSFGSLINATIVAIACGGFATLALDNQGKLHAWGNNVIGQGGGNSAVPVAISALGSLSGSTIVAIASGSGHHLALDATGRVHAWGANDQGQVGNATVTWPAAPVDISEIGSLRGQVITAIACGALHSMALDASGKTHTWGWNGHGQLGNNAFADSHEPIAISAFGSLSGNTVVSIGCGGNHTLAIDASGRIHAWGFNRVGAVGNPTVALGWDILSSQKVPILVSGYGSVGATLVASRAIIANAGIATTDLTANLLTVMGDTVLRGTASIRSDVTIGGSVTVQHNSTTNGYIHASGNIDTSGDLRVSGTIYAAGDISVSCNIHANGSIHATGSIDTNGNLVASGNIQANGDMYASCNLTASNLTACNNLTAGGGTF